jgi:hypothetical protein
VNSTQGRILKRALSYRRRECTIVVFGLMKSLVLTRGRDEKSGEFREV